MIEQFEGQRAQFLREAVEDAKKWCPAPEVLVGGKRSDQFWLQLFSPASASVTADDAFCFLVSFQLTNRIAWDKNAVATRINKFRQEASSDVRAAISALALDLGRCILSARKGRQVSAASKIAFFTRPCQDVYIWDQFARKAAGFRDGRSATFDDYASYSDSCARALEKERLREDFVDVFQEFRNYIRHVGGPMAESEIMDGSSFLERRILDKLMFWEGKWLQDRSAGNSAAQVAPERGSPPDAAILAPKGSKRRGERGDREDRFGNLLGSQAAAINATLGNEPRTAEAVSKETGLSVSRVKSHFRWLRDHGYGIESGWGFALKAGNREG
jgi:hypothetical protein